MSDEFHCDACGGWVDHIPGTDECPNYKKQPSMADQLAAVKAENNALRETKARLVDKLISISKINCVETQAYKFTQLASEVAAIDAAKGGEA